MQSDVNFQIAKKKSLIILVENSNKKNKKNKKNKMAIMTPMIGSSHLLAPLVQSPTDR